MAFTAVDVPYWSLPAAMTDDSDKRTKIFSVSRLSTTAASILASMIIVPLINLIGGGDMRKGYQGVAIVFAVLAAVLYFCSFLLVKENVQVSSNKFEFKKAVKAFSENRPLLLLIISSLISSCIMSMRMGMQMYYVQYNLGSLDLIPAISAASLPGIVLGSFLAPVLSRKLGKRNLMITGHVLTIVFGIVFYFVGYSDFNMVMIMIALMSFPLGINMVLLSSMTADTIEYAEWKTGQNNAALISSTQTLITKIGMAISGGVIGLVLTITNYVPNAEQTTQTLHAIHFSMSLLPGIASVLAIIPLAFYDLTKEKHEKIIEELRMRKENE
jgi:GPH family glycoside/pentoside/hexuronide:cation symporter/probable glucitol transport protein GutA